MLTTIYIRTCLGLLGLFRFLVSWFYCPIVPLFSIFPFPVTIFSALVLQYQKYIQWWSNLYFNLSQQNIQIAWYILNSGNDKQIDGHHLACVAGISKGSESGFFGARETGGKEGGKYLPGDYFICIININQVSVEITPSFLVLSSHFSSAGQNPEASHHWISNLLPSCPGSVSQHQSNQ